MFILSTFFMTAQLARTFFNLLWLTVTWNWVQTSNSDPRTKKEASSSSIPWWQCMEWNYFRCFKKRAIKKEKEFILPGQGAVRGRIYSWDRLSILVLSS